MAFAIAGGKDHLLCYLISSLSIRMAIFCLPLRGWLHFVKDRETGCTLCEYECILGRGSGGLRLKRERRACMLYCEHHILIAVKSERTVLVYY